MKKIFLSTIFVLTCLGVSATPTTKSIHKRIKHSQKIWHIENDLNALGQSYANFKNELAQKTGLSFGLDISFLGQRGNPSGKITPWQVQYYPYFNWNMFDSSIGSGSLQFSYTAVRYWGNNATNLGENLGVVSAVNDYPSNSNSFDQLSYTHQMPEKLDWLSVTLGQFPMYNFDGTAYNSNQQINFLNYALSQNASSAYPLASLGGFLTITPNEDWSFVVGFQDANNVDGTKIDTHHLGDHKYTSFISATYNPTIMNQSGQYSIMLYNQPSVQSQPTESNGWSINMQQFINEKVALFGRINGTSSSEEEIKQSYVLGGVYNNPFDRNSLDQFGLAVAVNKLNKSMLPQNTRSVESVIEGYYAFGISNFMTLTPDIQVYINPGQDPSNNLALVGSVRATLMF